MRIARSSPIAVADVSPISLAEACGIRRNGGSLDEVLGSREVEEIWGQADAKASAIYAEAYDQSEQSVAFYEFTRTMQAYDSIIADDTTMILSTDSELFRFLKQMEPGAGVDRPQAPGVARRQ